MPGPGRVNVAGPFCLVGTMLPTEATVKSSVTYGVSLEAVGDAIEMLEGAGYSRQDADYALTHHPDWAPLISLMTE